MPTVSDWHGTAFNQVPHSKNQIHGDDVAKNFGFKGGLVPGVTVSAYLLHPASVSYGLDFLQRGYAEVRVNSPLYDEQAFSVAIDEQDESGYAARLIPDGAEASAVAEVTLLDTQMNPPEYRGDTVVELSDSALPLVATPENMKDLMNQGCSAFRFQFDARHEMSTYLRDPTQMADVYTKEGFANPSFVLGVSNWVLASNAHMNPWVHMQTNSWHFSPLPAGREIIGEMQIEDLFSKKGHEFVDARVNLFDATSHACYAMVELRAIYRLRGL